MHVFPANERYQCAASTSTSDTSQTFRENRPTEKRVEKACTGQNETASSADDSQKTVTISTCETHIDVSKMLPDVELNEQNTERIVSVFGMALLNCSSGETMTITEAIRKKEFKFAQSVLDFAKGNGVFVKLTSGSEDILGWAIQHRSPDCVEFVLKMLTEKHATIEETSRILTAHFSELVALFPRVLVKYLRKDRFCFEYGRFSAPLTLFDCTDRQIAMITDRITKWEAQNSEEVKSLWIENNKEVREQLKNSSDPSEVQITAVSKFFCIEDTDTHGPANLLFPLTVSDVPADVYHSEAMSTLVRWKWDMYCKKRFRICFLLHVIASISFSVFASCYNRDDEQISNDPKLLISRLSLGVSCVIVWVNNVMGIRPRVRIFSAVTTCILFIHVLRKERHETHTYVITSVECISFWVSVLYYFQPFKTTGPLTSMIRFVFWDIMPFGILGTLIIIGFGMAFLVLSDHVEHYGDFTTPLRSFQSLFHAMLGQFKNDDMSDSDSGDCLLTLWTLVLFNWFLLVGGIVLLSLLVAILGDTYDRVKLTEAAEIVKCRARFVGILDGWNNILEKIMRTYVHLLHLFGLTRLAPKTLNVFLKLTRDVRCPHKSVSRKRFFHFLVPAEPIVRENESNWHGKILSLMRLIKTELREKEERTIANEAKLKTELAKQHSELKAELKTLATQLNTMEHLVLSLANQANISPLSTIPESTSTNASRLRHKSQSV